MRTVRLVFCIHKSEDAPLKIFERCILCETVCACIFERAHDFREHKKARMIFMGGKTIIIGGGAGRYGAGNYFTGNRWQNLS